MQWAAAPWRHAWRYINVSQLTSKFLSKRLRSRCHLGDKTQSHVSIRVGLSFSRRFKTTTTCVRDGSAPRAGVQRDGNCSLTLQTVSQLVSKLHSGKSRSDADPGTLAARLVSQQLLLCRGKKPETTSRLTTQAAADEWELLLASGPALFVHISSKHNLF